MGACISSCLASCACAACCKACSCTCLLPPFASNVVYCALFFVATIVALVFRYEEIPLRICLDVSGSDCDDSQFWTSVSSYSYDLCGGDECAGQWAVYRISFALTIFFGSLLLFTFFKTKASVYMHRGFWFGKIIAFAGVLVATLFMPNDVFAYFAWVARFVAPGFLIYQTIFFIDFGYTVNETLVEMDEPPRHRFLCSENESGWWYKRVLLTLSLIFYAITFAGVGLLYHYFPQDCAFNPLAITLTLVFLLLNSIISVSKIAEGGSIFTSSLVAAYTMWLAYSAMASMPFESCNPLATEPTPATTAISIVIAGCSMLWIAFTAGRRETKRRNPANDQVTVDVPSSDDEVLPASFWNYHLVFLLLSFYMSMLLTNWGQTSDDNANSLHSSGVASAWVQLGSSWLCSVLYMWTLVAPWLFPNRDFS